jgi:DNA repair photolyase
MVTHISETVGQVVAELRENQWKNRGGIYVPKGPAREYAEFAISLYKGCEHGCTYCFAPSQLRMSRADFYKVKLRADILTRLEQDAIRMKEFGWTDARVLMSFTTDPYPKLDEEIKWTRLGINLLHEHQIGVTILTKAGEIAQRDIPLFTKKDQFATTLTCLNEQVAAKWEPGAATPLQRIANLKAAHERGIPTWVSVEPVFDPLQAFSAISVAADYVDEFRIGMWNHDKRAKQIDYAEFVRKCQSYFHRIGQAYVIKTDLKRAAGLI